LLPEVALDRFDHDRSIGQNIRFRAALSSGRLNRCCRRDAAMTSIAPYLAEVAQLVGDPARANILAALMDGRAASASDLAITAHVSPQTASFAS
jgi:hypothetical protein